MPITVCADNLSQALAPPSHTHICVGSRGLVGEHGDQAHHDGAHARQEGQAAHQHQGHVPAAGEGNDEARDKGGGVLQENPDLRGSNRAASSEDHTSEIAAWPEHHHSFGSGVESARFCPWVAGSKSIQALARNPPSQLPGPGCILVCV